MLITKDFILINFPKTGSSFTRKVIKSILDRREENIFFQIMLKLDLRKKSYIELSHEHHLYKKININYSDQHGIYSQIPHQYIQGRKVVSILRDPYEKLFSAFEYKFWKSFPFLEKSIIESNFRNFHELDINDFIDFLKLVAKHTYLNGKEIKVGYFSLQFIYYYFKDPETIINNLNETYLASDTIFKKDIAKIHFLNQSNLNQDLVNFLSGFDYTLKELDYVKSHKKVNTTNYNIKDKSLYYTPKVIEYMEEYEYFLLNVYRFITKNQVRINK